MPLGSHLRTTKAFTLVELLIVIAILSILAIVTVFVLNPSELLKQSRDSTRLNDLASLNTAINLLQVDQPGSSLGSANIVYVSIPDSTSTCANIGLPSLPVGWSYQCASTSTYTKVDGTGWIPVNLTLLSTGAPLGRLPFDPTNATSSGLYYTYVTSGSAWEFSSVMEAAKYRYGGKADRASTDGGNSTSFYEMGSNLTLNPINDSGLVGWWKFDEGAGSTVADASGRGNTLTWSGAQIGSSGYYTSGKVGVYAGAFATSTSDAASAATSLDGQKATLTFWEKIPSVGSLGVNFRAGSYWTSGSWGFRFGTDFGGPNGYNFYAANSQWGIGGLNIPAGTWNMTAVTFDDVGKTATGYLNGVYVGSVSFPTYSIYLNAAKALNLIRPGSETEDDLDDVRLYNRVLSAAEIMALYNASK